jgi:hypothetical protein
MNSKETELSARSKNENDNSISSKILVEKKKVLKNYSFKIVFIQWKVDEGKHQLRGLFLVLLKIAT